MQIIDLICTGFKSTKLCLAFDLNNLIMQIDRFLLPCLNKQLFGIDCLGCGLQRAIIQIFEGNFKLAFIQFPAVYSTLLFLIVLGFHFADQSRNYSKVLIVTAVVNASIMLLAYFYKINLSL
jgi:hypothetical protein